MRTLLINPIFPTSFFSFEKAVKLMGKKTILPPLGLITVAAIFPDDWEFKLVDRNVRDVSDEEWEWADTVMLSAMNVQREDFLGQIEEAKLRNKTVVVGGPYATSYIDEVINSKADYLVLDEGEVTIPLFLDALKMGKRQRIFRSSEKPDITQTPTPRFDLLEFQAYADMSIQFSRGCPFLCEFCDIITLYGRKPRTKTPAQMMRELESLYQLGWRGEIFMVDDNFIGNKKNVLSFLLELNEWLEEKDWPFSFYTEASINLAKEKKLIDAMITANFNKVFLGIETPDAESLSSVRKNQNLRDSLSDSILTIQKSGLEVWAGFIIGFDGEKSGAGQRVVNLIEESSVPLAFLNMLQVLPNTALWDRLKKTDRLLSEVGDMNQTTLINFIPTRPTEEIANEFLHAFWHLYEPKNFLDRVFKQFMKLGERPAKIKKTNSPSKLKPHEVMLTAKLFFRYGVLWNTRWVFWRYLYLLYRHNSRLVPLFLTRCVLMEHFVDCREEVSRKIKHALATQTFEQPRRPEMIVCDESLSGVVATFKSS